MLVYTVPSYPTRTPRVVYSNPPYASHQQFVETEEQQLRNYIEAAASRQYLAHIEEQRVLADRRPFAARYGIAPGGRHGYVPHGQLPFRQQRAPVVVIPNFEEEEERNVEDYVGNALAELLGLREAVEEKEERIKAEKVVQLHPTISNLNTQISSIFKVRVEQAKQAAAIENARKAAALREALRAAAYEEARKAKALEEARKAAALEHVQKMKAKQEAERIHAIHQALKAAAFAEARQHGIFVRERNVEPKQEAEKILSIREALKAAASTCTSNK
ncbi:hypothetical protein M422DRAFT_50734 [Sphaerobolus stellatus SS14]|uniref:Uncharacterized protein n=1 Tax=Sphaerobolus stellatus (strain SS14) TaxID=990650 RepID=A0A0C9VIH6_SPHS4|nr:hypothetical protein M422DRAFT_50734 [Sphaerobolus stellatus SS14]